MSESDSLAKSLQQLSTIGDLSFDASTNLIVVALGSHCQSQGFLSALYDEAAAAVQRLQQVQDDSTSRSNIQPTTDDMADMWCTL